MNKKQLVAKLAKTTSISQVKAMEIINALFDAENGTGILVKEIINNNKVTIPGFGTFGVKVRKGRRGVNPSTHAHMEIAPKRHVFFKVGKNLKTLALAESASS